MVEEFGAVFAPFSHADAQVVDGHVVDRVVRGQVILSEGVFLNFDWEVVDRRLARVHKELLEGARVDWKTQHAGDQLLGLL